MIEREVSEQVNQTSLNPNREWLNVVGRMLRSAGAILVGLIATAAFSLS